MKTAAALSAIIALANAHATWQQLWKNGEDLESTCARLPPSNSPIEDYSSTALQCNVNPAAASGTCGFEAGDTVTIEMHQHNNRDCTTEGLGGAHWGPVLAYMGKVEDAASADGSGEFFKIYENGWKKNPAASQGDADFWGTKDLNYNCGKLDFKIPSDIAPGDYLLRAEAIALHAAGPAGGAQHYVTCYQLTVTGSGTLVPKGVTFPEAYSKTGPGLGFSIHANLDSYPMPGPELIASGTSVEPQLLTFGTISGSPAGGNGPAKPASSAAPAPASSSAVVASSSAVVEAVSSVAAPVVSPTPQVTSTPSLPAAPFPIGNSSVIASPTAAPIVTSRFSTASSALPSTLATIVRPQPSEGASNGAIKEWAQCGGNGFQGAGACASGLVCKEWNPYYSQCIKSEGNAPAPANPQPSQAAPVTPQPTKVAPEANKPTKVAPVPSKPTKVATPPSAPTKVAPAPSVPSGSAPSEKTYTLETFIAFLEENAGSASAAKMRRMIEALL
jgi:cellulase